MRLAKCCSIKNRDFFLIVRHGKDDVVLTQTLDQPLIDDGRTEIKELAEEISVFYKNQTRFSGGINLFHSPRQRAYQSARLMKEIFIEWSVPSYCYFKFE